MKLRTTGDVSPRRKARASPVVGDWPAIRRYAMPVTRTCVIDAGTIDTPSSAATRFTIDEKCGAS